MDEYKVHANDLLAAFRVIPQPGVPPEESDALAWASSMLASDFLPVKCFSLSVWNARPTACRDCEPRVRSMPDR